MRITQDQKDKNSVFTFWFQRSIFIDIIVFGCIIGFSGERDRSKNIRSDHFAKVLNNDMALSSLLNKNQFCCRFTFSFEASITTFSGPNFLTYIIAHNTTYNITKYHNFYIWQDRILARERGGAES